MKKIILIITVALLVSFCKKNTTTPLAQKVYCMSTEDGGAHVARGCASSKEEMQNKTVELRNQGYVNIKSTEKSKCSECN